MEGSVKIRTGAAGDLVGLELLWNELYRQQQRQGMLLKLPADAFERWRESLVNTLGRFTCVWLAEQNGKLVGFLAARLRSLPAQWGGQQVGYISDVFVSESLRGQSVGKRLIEASYAWFREAAVDRVELHITVGNESAKGFYERLGWKEELIQLVGKVPPA